jgi:hypothetical protein
MFTLRELLGSDQIYNIILFLDRQTVYDKYILFIALIRYRIKEQNS